MIERTGARHLVSAIDSILLPPTPSLVPPDRHLRLEMHDVVEARLDSTLPARDHVRQLVAFIASWDRRDPILIHCYAGLSRSTAAAFIALCVLNPRAPEDVLARALRRASDTAVPNRLFVALADEELGREGRMTAALARMGAHRIANECVPFRINALHGLHALDGAGQAA